MAMLLTLVIYNTRCVEFCLRLQKELLKNPTALKRFTTQLDPTDLA